MKEEGGRMKTLNWGRGFSSFILWLSPRPVNPGVDMADHAKTFS